MYATVTGSPPEESVPDLCRLFSVHMLTWPPDRAGQGHSEADAEPRARPAAKRRLHVAAKGELERLPMQGGERTGRVAGPLPLPQVHKVWTWGKP